MKKIRKYFFALLVLVGVGVVAMLSFINFHPVFGGNPSREQIEIYQKFNNYADGKFANQVSTKMNMGIADVFSMLRESIWGSAVRKPVSPIPVSEIDWKKIKSEEDSVTWFGHSAFLLSIDNKKLLVDPMLSSVAAPVSFIGSKRYSGDMLHIIDEMPPIDAVLITHDHYDHLDYPSIVKLQSKVGHFFVPYGVSAHLIRWGVAQEKITELNWWDEVPFQGLTVALTPSKHFSGRGMLNRNTTLWGGWVVLGKHTRFYTSGDGGYDGHFKEIGRKYGPFDVTLIEGGQYDRRWSWVHMIPEEAVQAHKDVNGRNMMLIHWGAFTLAFHDWTEPIERASIEAKKQAVNLIAPRIGETVTITSEIVNPVSKWWEL